MPVTLQLKDHVWVGGAGLEPIEAITLSFIGPDADKYNVTISSADAADPDAPARFIPGTRLVLVSDPRAARALVGVGLFEFVVPWGEL